MQRGCFSSSFPSKHRKSTCSFSLMLIRKQVTLTSAPSVLCHTLRFLGIPIASAGVSYSNLFIRHHKHPQFNGRNSIVFEKEHTAQHNDFGNRNQRLTFESKKKEAKSIGLVSLPFSSKDTIVLCKLFHVNLMHHSTNHHAHQ